MLVDANILLYAVDSESPFHARAHGWLEDALNGTRRVALPWSSLSAFVRIATHPRAMREPLDPADACDLVDAWLEAPAAWVPVPGDGYRHIFGRLIRELDLRGNLVADAAIAALCIEHGLEIVSADTDFARFTEITWLNPLS
jgi:uncharacterized protein